MLIGLISKWRIIVDEVFDRYQVICNKKNYYIKQIITSYNTNNFTPLTRDNYGITI
jgi:hypothetical protein